jgi:hypothetical protein
MGMPLSVLPPGILVGAAPGVSKVSPNTRVSTAAGPIGTIADVVQAPAAVGNWVVGAMRVKIGGLPAINQASVGTSVTVPGVPGPMTVTLGDARVSGL